MTRFHSDYAIGRLTGTFRTAETERAFLAAYWSQLSARGRLLGIFGGSLFLLVALSDYRSLGLSDGFWWLLSARLLVFAMGLALYWAARAPAYFTAFPYWVLAFEVAVGSAFFLVAITRGGDIHLQAMGALAVAGGFYFFAPNIRTPQMLVPGAVSAGFVAVAVGGYGADLKTVTPSAIVLGLVNIFGIHFVRHQGRAARAEYRNLELLRSLNEKRIEETGEHLAAVGELRQRERDLRRLFEVAPVPMLLSRAEDGTVARMNRAAEKLLGLEFSAQKQVSIRDLYANPGDAELLVDALRATGEAGAEEVCLKGPGGNIPVLLSAERTEFDGEDSHIVGMVDLTERKFMEEKLRRLATTDPLTEAYNRRFFFEVAERELRLSERNGKALSLLLMDLDHFKEVNDRYGHSAGDHALREFVDAVRTELREYDLLARLGGEEFGILLTDTHALQADAIAERVRETVAQRQIRADDVTFSVTVSIGVARLQPSDGVEEALRKADRALYQAKEAGRNRIMFPAS